MNFPCLASFIDNIVSGILEAIAAIKKAEINKSMLYTVEIVSTTSIKNQHELPIKITEIRTTNREVFVFNFFKNSRLNNLKFNKEFK